MEFEFDVRRVFGGEPIAVVNAAVLRRVSGAARRSIETVIDAMGNASMRAQGLSAVLTTAHKLSCSDCTLFLATDRKRCLGIIKVGRKHLFIRDEKGGIKEITPLCVLDFYVHESCQRSGIGKRLFVYMLEHNRTTPAQLGYDRPSHKFLNFLSRHYGLKDYVPQANNFVVFKRYWDRDSCSAAPRGASSVKGRGKSRERLVPEDKVWGSRGSAHGTVASRSQRGIVQSRDSGAAAGGAGSTAVRLRHSGVLAPPPFGVDDAASTLGPSRRSAVDASKPVLQTSSLQRDSAHSSTGHELPRGFVPGLDSQEASTWVAERGSKAQLPRVPSRERGLLPYKERMARESFVGNKAEGSTVRGPATDPTSAGEGRQQGAASGAASASTSGPGIPLYGRRSGSRGSTGGAPFDSSLLLGTSERGVGRRRGSGNSWAGTGAALQRSAPPGPAPGGKAAMNDVRYYSPTLLSRPF